jgi:exodeoxyribonuclease V alpha subunit
VTPTVESLRTAGVLAPLDEHCARTLARLADDDRPLVLLATALASRQVGLGHVCVDLPALVTRGDLAAESGDGATDVRWPALDAWLAALRSSPLVGPGTSAERRPLVLDAAGRLYLRRYFEHEQRLAGALRRRAAAADPALDAADLEDALARLFPPSGPGSGSAANPAATEAQTAVASTGETSSAGAPTATAPTSASPHQAARVRGGRTKVPVASTQLELALGGVTTGSSSIVDPGAPSRGDAADDAAAGAADRARAATGPDLQRAAARTAASRRLCVISGGPGTGKTSTVVKILALLAEPRVRVAGPPLRALLLAPTGKAAMRLTEAIRRAKDAIPCSDAVRAAIPEEASTIHRALGSIDGSSTRFRHDRAHPLRADVVLVDEASMVDLALMARLVEAVPDDARLVLLGDKDQLASVEAGAVLGELCDAAQHRACDPGLAASTVALTTSYRYGAKSGIEALAQAINRGDAARALAILDDPDLPDVARVAPGEVALSALLRAAAVAGFRHYLDERDPAARLRALERFRILCAHRHGPYGVVNANAELEAALIDEGWLRRDVALAYLGRPVIVTRNDYQLQLFNGDVGTIVEQDGKRLAFFVAPDGTPRLLSPARLPPHETVFAMTVHKSQGSEFDDVAVLLGDRPSPLLSRELLYTAVTRARRRVTLHTTAEVVAAAIARPTERASGLCDALRGAATT